MSDIVTYALSDGVAVLTMDDGKANAMAPAMLAALNAALDRAATEANAIVFRGKAGLLCGGFDLKIIRGEDEALKAAMRDAGMKLMQRIYMSPLPIVFACTGHAVAMGALLLLAGDARIGMRGDFKIGLNETAIGLSLPVAGLELARDRIVPTELTNAAILATLYSPDDAVRVGYLDEVADADVFDVTVKDRAKQLGELDRTAFATTKGRVRQATIDRIAAAS
ncbi:MAG: crotonase/enoyl-CoA hydratase family protein [Alphaproteobacteria bacterium]|jgi:enoyl-CoA hydratase